MNTIQPSASCNSHSMVVKFLQIIALSVLLCVSHAAQDEPMPNRILAAEKKAPRKYFTAKYSGEIDLTQFNNHSSETSPHSFQHLNEEWCQHLQEYPDEPHILLYPRMPKCGSSTIDTLFMDLAEKNDFIFAKTPREDWTNLDKDKAARKHVLEIMHDAIYDKKVVVIEGHYDKINFPHDKIDDIRHNNKHIETIQLTRDCIGRSTSLFFYTLFQQKTAHQAKKHGHTKEYFLKKLNISKNSQDAKTFNFDECIEDYNCVKGFGFTTNDYNGLRHLCGGECLKQISGKSVSDFNMDGTTSASHSNLVKGAIYNAVHPDHFTVIGTLSHIEEYLEMLECAYPNILRGILQYYQKNEIHSNSGKASTKYKHTEALTKVIRESCDPETSEAGYVYNKLYPYFRSRYQFMKENKDRCCRKFKPNNKVKGK